VGGIAIIYKHQFCSIYGGKQLAKKLQELIYAIWREEKMPADWETGIICPVFKQLQRHYVTGHSIYGVGPAVLIVTFVF
jgi:hypothetical protein